MSARPIKKLLSEPYPYYYSEENLIRLSAAVLLICFVFIFFFEPFVVYRPEHKIHFFWISLIHATVPSVVGYVYFSVVNVFFRKDDNYTIGNEVVNLLTVLLLVGLVNFLIRDLIYSNPDNWSWKYFSEEIGHALLVGMLIIAVLVPLNFNRLFRKYHHTAAVLQEKYHTAYPGKESHEEVFIKTQVKGDDFKLNISDFLFARAAGNYSEVILSSGDKRLKRISIKELEQQLTVFPWIIKTHRAYLVNIQKIKDIKGNAQGYTLTFDEYQEKVPVSRSMIPVFNDAIGNAS